MAANRPFSKEEREREVGSEGDGKGIGRRRAVRRLGRTPQICGGDPSPSSSSSSSLCSPLPSPSLPSPQFVKKGVLDFGLPVREGTSPKYPTRRPAVAVRLLLHRRTLLPRPESLLPFLSHSLSGSRYLWSF